MVMTLFCIMLGWPHEVEIQVQVEIQGGVDIIYPCTGGDIQGGVDIILD